MYVCIIQRRSASRYGHRTPSIILYAWCVVCIRREGWGKSEICMWGRKRGQERGRVKQELGNKWSAWDLLRNRWVGGKCVVIGLCMIEGHGEGVYTKIKTKTTN